MIDSQAGLPWGWETLGMSAPVQIHTRQRDFVACPVGPIAFFSSTLGSHLQGLLQEFSQEQNWIE